MKAPLKFLILTGIYVGMELLSLNDQGIAATSSRRTAKISAPQQKQLKMASDFYDNKKFDEAIDILGEVLQKQADNLPAKILLARCLYQRNRFADVHKLLQGVDPELLDPDVRYEGAQAAFRENDLAAALTGFRSVPEGHPLYDLAGYYGGIAAFKKGEYENAIELFEHAVVLPSKLVRSRKLYLKESERLLVQKQKPNPQAPVDTTPTPPPSPSLTPGVGPQPSTSLPPPVMEEANKDRSYRSFRPIRSLSLTPRYTLQEHETADNHVTDHTIKSGELRLSLGFSEASSERSAHYLLQAHASIMALEGASGERPLLGDARTEQRLALTAKESPQSMIYSEAFGGIEWPLGSIGTGGLMLGAFVHSVEMIADASVYSPWLSLFMALHNNWLEGSINLSAFAPYLDGDLQYSNTRESGRVQIDLPAHFLIGMQLESSQYNYPNAKTDGRDWLVRGLVELGFQMDNNFSLFFGTFYETSRNIKTIDVEPKQQLSYAETIQGFSARAELALFSFLKLGLQAQNASLQYADLNPNKAVYDEAFRPTYIQGISHFSVYSTLGVSF